MAEQVNQYELGLLSEMKRGSQSAFSVLFGIYYADLLLYCGTFIRERKECEDIVQDIFYKLWNDRRELKIDTSLKAYLLRAVRNGCFDAFRHRKIERNHVCAITATPSAGNLETENYVLYSDLQSRLDEVLEQLDEKAAEAFRMNRFENLKYREIAERLQVSERTVEVRIGKALEFIRSHLHYFAMLLFFIGRF